MLRRRFAACALILFAVLGISAGVYAQLESGDRGILPIDSSGTLEITGIKVDVGGTDAQSARFAGWRIAQREGFRQLWAKMHRLPVSQAPTPADSVLDSLVSSIIVEREQIGPNRYIATLGVLFDRARSAQLLGVGGQTRRSQPMLLIPILVNGGTATSVELRNAWQRAWAQFRTSQSAIDYVRVSGLGVDPMLINAAQTQRPGRGWWRNVTDLYGAADILVAEVSLQRAFPGGPARARFIARHGPDNEIIGGFTLTVQNSEAIPALMNRGVQRMDELFQTALAAGRLERDPTLDIPEPPPLPEELVEEAAPEQRPTTQTTRAWTYQVQIVSPDPQIYNFAVAHIRTLGGVEQTQVMGVNIGGISYVHVGYRGDLASLGAALAGRGWTVENLGGVIRISGNAGPPPRPAPPAPAPTPTQQPPAQPALPAPQQPSGAAPASGQQQ